MPKPTRAKASPHNPRKSGTKEQKKAARVKAYSILREMSRRAADEVWLRIFGKQRKLKPMKSRRFDALARHNKLKRRTKAKGNQ